MALHEFRLPPGLRDLANEVGLTEAQVEQYARAWDTIRGHRPKTLAEWLPFYEATKQFFEEGEANEQAQT